MSIFSNAHWLVEDDGMSTIWPLAPYNIDLGRVFETTKRGSQTFYDWPVHIAEKTWVNASLFNDAFDRAIHHYSAISGESIDQAMLDASYAQALLIEATYR